MTVDVHFCKILIHNSGQELPAIVSTLPIACKKWSLQVWYIYIYRCHQCKVCRVNLLQKIDWHLSVFFQIFSNLWCPVTIMSARCFCSSCLERSQDDYGNMSRPGQVQPLGNHSEQVKYVHKNYEKPVGSTKQAWNPEKGKPAAVLSMAVAWETKDARKLS